MMFNLGFFLTIVKVGYRVDIGIGSEDRDVVSLIVTLLVYVPAMIMTVVLSSINANAAAISVRAFRPRISSCESKVIVSKRSPSRVDRRAGTICRILRS